MSPRGELSASGRLLDPRRPATRHYAVSEDPSAVKPSSGLLLARKSVLVIPQQGEHVCMLHFFRLCARCGPRLRIGFHRVRAPLQK